MRPRPIIRKSDYFRRKYKKLSWVFRFFLMFVIMTAQLYIINLILNVLPPVILNVLAGLPQIPIVEGELTLVKIVAFIGGVSAIISSIPNFLSYFQESKTRTSENIAQHERETYIKILSNIIIPSIRKLEDNIQALDDESVGYETAAEGFRKVTLQEPIDFTQGDPMLTNIFKEEYREVYDGLNRYEVHLDELDFHARDVAERLRLPVAGWIHLEDTFNEGFYDDDGDENAAVRVAINKIMNQDGTIDFVNLRPEGPIPKQSVNHISEQFENTLEEDIETKIKYHYIDDKANKFIDKRNELLKISKNLHDRLVDIKDELRKEYNIQQEEIQQPMRAFI